MKWHGNVVMWGGSIVMQCGNVVKQCESEMKWRHEEGIGNVKGRT